MWIAGRRGACQSFQPAMRRSLPQMRYKASLLEHSLRAKEGEADALRGRLADKVDKEERRAARDKAAYGRRAPSKAAAGAAGPLSRARRRPA